MKPGVKVIVGLMLLAFGVTAIYVIMVLSSIGR